MKEKLRLTGGEIIVEHLIREGVPWAIGIAGHGNLALVDALFARQDQISVLQPRTENAAVYMADGYFRTTGRPLAVFTSIGPGAVNTAIGVATAYVDSTSVLVLTGDTHTHMMGKGVLQEIERQRDSGFSTILSSITKRTWRATSPGQLPSILRRAFNEMLTGRRGPVLVSLPMDVQADAAEAELALPAQHRSDSPPAGDSQAIERAAALLAESERPVILAGGGVNASKAWAELKAVAEMLGAAVVTTLQAKGCFPEDHELAGWLTGSKGTRCGLHLATTADVMLAVGCRFADETTSSYRPGHALSIPPTKLLHLDIEAKEIGKNYPVEVGIVGDAKASLRSLVEALQSTGAGRERRAGYVDDIRSQREAWLGDVNAWADDAKEPMMITSLLREMRAFLEREAIVASSSGNTQAQILQEFPFYEPRTNLTTGGFSTMGWAFPAALGAKLAAPDRQVVAVVGDGDFSMTMAEVATACQYDLPVVVVIANNCGWISIKDLQTAAYGEERAFAVDFVDRNGSAYTPQFAEIARAFGAYGQRISKAEEVRPALGRAFDSGKPAVIEAMVNREHPYTGSPAHGWWDVPVPTYLTDRRQKYEQERKEERL